MSKILELLGQKATDGLTPDQGLGRIGWWPACPEGQRSQTVNVVLIGYEANENGEFSWKNPSPGTTACLDLQFFYQLEEDPDHDGEPRTFDGDKLQIPYDSSVLPKGTGKPGGGNQKGRAEIQEKRFLGMAKTLTGETFSNFADAYAAMMDEIKTAEENGTAIVLTVRLDYDDKQRPDTERWQERQS